MPIVPLAPGRFSMTMGCPRAGEMALAMARAVMSVVEPGVKGTTKFIGFPGYSAARQNDVNRKNPTMAMIDFNVVSCVLFRIDFSGIVIDGASRSA